MHPSGDQPGNVRHIYHQIGPHTVRDLAQTWEVDDAGVGAGPGQDKARFVLLSQCSDGVVVQHLSVGAHTVVDEVIELAREVESGAMGEMPTVIQLHGQYRVARLEQGQIGCAIGLGARVRLNVGILGTKEFFGPLPGQFFGHVYELATAIVAMFGVTLGVFVGQH